MFDYIIEKIKKKELIYKPYCHLYIEDLLSDDHFSSIVSAREINIPTANCDADLFKSLFERGYKIIPFPGCIENEKKYIKWHKFKKKKLWNTESSCESSGVTLRLKKPETEIIIKLKNFLTSNEFSLAIAEKFNLQLSDTYLDNGIQKYLDGYEISPHPDRKSKAATFMININPHKNSESLIHHTHYLKTKSEYSYVTNFWKNNPDVQRCWIPWDWCETNYVQSKNNSMVAFSPSEETLHAVKANYNHLAGQRTQLYGNLWHKKTKPLIENITWENLDFKNKNISGKSNIRLKLINALPSQVKKIYHKYILRDVDNIENIRDKKN